MKNYKCSNCSREFDGEEVVKHWGSNLCEECCEKLFDEED